MTSPTDTPLLPCAHCGGEGFQVQAGDFYRIDCRTCRASGPTEFPLSRAEATWNRRVVRPAPAEGVDWLMLELRRDCRMLRDIMKDGSDVADVLDSMLKRIDALSAAPSPSDNRGHKHLEFRHNPDCPWMISGFPRCTCFAQSPPSPSDAEAARRVRACFDEVVGGALTKHTGINRADLEWLDRVAKGEGT